MYNSSSNPDKLDENATDNMSKNLVSDYYSLDNDKVNDILDVAGSKVLSVFHCNVRSFARNLTLLYDLIYCISSKPDILAVTESKLNENTLTNVDIFGYSFYHVQSPTNAAGAGLYVKQNLQAIA